MLFFFLFGSFFFLLTAGCLYFTPQRRLLEVMGIKEEKVITSKLTTFSNAKYFMRIAGLSRKYGLTTTSAQIALVVAIATTVVYVIGLILFRSQILAIISAIIAFFASPKIYIFLLREQLRERINHQISELVFSMSSAVESGSTILSALESAGNDVPDPLGNKIKAVYQSVKHSNESLEVALNKMVVQLGSHAMLKKFAISIESSRVTGGSLVEALNGVNKMVHDEIHTKKLIKSFSAQGMMSAGMLNFVPIISLVAFNNAMPGVVANFFYGSFIGQIILFYCVWSIIAGWFVISYLLKKSF